MIIYAYVFIDFFYNRVSVDCGLWIVDCGLWIVDCGLCECGLFAASVKSIKEMKSV